MPRYKGNERQNLMVPVNLEEQLLPGTIEHAINFIIDQEVDLSGFDLHYHNQDSGRPAYDPKAMLKVILFAYSKGILSSRRIEEACKSNIVFMALCGDVHPDHTTLSRFISGRSDGIRGVFRDVLVVAAQNDLIGAEVFALDGCKIPSNAAKEHSGSFAEIRRKIQKLEARLEAMIKEHRSIDAKEDNQQQDGGGEQSHGCSREQKYRRAIDRAKQFLATHQPRIGAQGKEVKSNISDNESAKLKSGSGYVQGYNALALVDAKHQLVVHAEPIGQINEAPLLPRMIRRGVHAIRKAGVDAERLRRAVFLADTNYFCEANARFFFTSGLDGYLPDQRFRSRDPRFETRTRERRAAHRKFSGQDFLYDASNDSYRCPADRTLTFYTHTILKGTAGVKYRADEADCGRCSLAARCLKKGASRRSVFVAQDQQQNFSRAMTHKVDTTVGRTIYAQRMGIVEPVFANITSTKGMRRFTLRGRAKVRIQWLYYCLVHNIEKLATTGTCAALAAA